MAALRHVVLVAGILVAFLYFIRPAVPGIPYVYDEADYMYAATRGFAANYTDSPSMSLWEYVRTGMDAVHSGSRARGFSELIRESGDLNFYRHAHGALHSYWLWLISPWQDQEWMVRALSMVFPVVAAIAIYVLSLRLLPGAAGQLAALLNSSLYLWGGTVRGTVEIVPHHMFMLWVTLALLFTAKAMLSGQRPAWYAATAFAALAFVTLEVAFVLVFAILVCAWVQSRQSAPDWRLLRNCVLLFLSIAIVLHPPALLALHIVKSYLFMAYLALFRQNVWGNVTLLDAWKARLAMAPVEWILIAAAVPLWLRFRKTEAARAAFPFLVYGLAMLVVVGRLTATSPRYSLPFLPALGLFAGFTLAGSLAGLRPGPRYASVAVLCLAQFAAMAWQAATRPPRTEFGPVHALRTIREQRLEDKRLLVPQSLIPVFHYYFQKAEIDAYADEETLRARLSEARYDAVIHPDDRVVQP